MKIEDLCIQKGSFKLIVKDIEFLNKGIYLLKGKNGSGKTTFIETILKQNKTINMTEKEKSKDIAYFSQSLYKYPMTAGTYIGDNHPELIKKYCDFFEVDYLHKDIMNISGGEFVILALIRCFVRDTPIMIFDEPTNNLDDGKTKKVNDLLNEISSRKTIIVSTHDDRLNLKYHTEYRFDNGQIIKTLQEKNNIIKEIK